MPKISKNFLFTILFLAFFSNIAAQERYLRPVDEGKNDASFNAFREKLIAAVKKRDTKYLVSVLDRNVKASFGGDDGIEDFKRFWKIESPNTKLWDELLKVLTNGGKFSREGTTVLFAAPYSYSHFPEELDMFEYQVIFGSNVNLRAKPDEKAEIITRLSYNIVKVDFLKSVTDPKDETRFLWKRIETLGGKSGFVKAEFVRSPIDFRAIFEKKNGRWKLISFVAGD